MDEATKQALNQFVAKMLSAAEQSATWTADQAPLVIQEWLRWELIINAVWSGIWLGAFVAVWMASAKMIVLGNSDHGDDDIIAAAWVIRVIFGVVFCGLSIGYALDSMKVYAAPKVVVLEYFASLVKK